MWVLPRMHRRRLGAPSESKFRLLWIGQSSSLLGSALVPVALSFAVLDLTGSVTDLGLVFAARELPQMAFVLLGGVVGDRSSRRLVVLTADLISAGGQACLAVLLLTSSAQLWHFLLIGALSGMASAFSTPALSGLTVAVVGTDRLQRANALLETSANAAFTVGPVLSGVIVAGVGPGVAFAVDAASFTVSAVSLLLLGRLPEAEREPTPFLQDLIGGWQELRSRTWLWVLTLFSAGYALFVFAPLVVLGPLVARQSLGGARGWGVIAAAFSLGAVAGGVTLTRWMPQRPLRVACSLMLATALPPALLALRVPLPVVAGAQVLSGACATAFNILMITTVQQRVPPEAIARVTAWDLAGTLALMPLGYLLAGPLAGGLGIDTLLWLGAGWVVVSTLGVLLVPSIRDLAAG